MPDRIADIYIWNKIERILFNPERKGKDISKWFNQYHKFVLKLWGLDPEIHKGKEYSFNFDDKIAFSFTTPFDLPKFSIDFKQGEIKHSFHYDDNYFSEIDLVDIFNTGIDNKKLSDLKQTKPDKVFIERVLQSMVVHPALHHHLKNLSDFVRINFNTKNPFLFLYQLAFQLADYKNDFRVSELKKKELNKLVELVASNIANQTKIPSGELFKVIKIQKKNTV